MLKITTHLSTVFDSTQLVVSWLDYSHKSIWLLSACHFALKSPSWNNFCFQINEVLTNVSRLQHICNRRQKFCDFHRFIIVITTNRLHVIANLTPFNRKCSCCCLITILMQQTWPPFSKQPFQRQWEFSSSHTIAVVSNYCFADCDGSITRSLFATTGDSLSTPGSCVHCKWMRHELCKI